MSRPAAAFASLLSLTLIQSAVASDVPFVGQSAILPPTYTPRTAIYQIGAPNHHYERWTATACDTKRTFLVGLWPVPQGGADYKVVEIPPGVEP